LEVQHGCDRREEDISDALNILGCKFLGEACPDCCDAADANDDGGHDISDVLYILNFLFLGGPAPAAPGPRECGVDPTDDDELPPCGFEVCRWTGA
jgi:hypothetical protein